MPAKDLRDLDNAATQQKATRKSTVKGTQAAKAATGKIQTAETAIASAAMVSAQKANNYLLEKANVLKAGGAEFARALVALEENADAIFLNAAEQHYQMLRSGTPATNQIDGWVYDSELHIDFNQTLQQCLTVGDEKPMLTGTAQY